MAVHMSLPPNDVTYCTSYTIVRHIPFVHYFRHWPWPHHCDPTISQLSCLQRFIELTHRDLPVYLCVFISQFSFSCCTGLGHWILSHPSNIATCYAAYAGCGRFLIFWQKPSTPPIWLWCCHHFLSLAVFHLFTNRTIPAAYVGSNFCTLKDRHAQRSSICLHRLPHFNELQVASPIEDDPTKYYPEFNTPPL